MLKNYISFFILNFLIIIACHASPLFSIQKTTVSMLNNRVTLNIPDLSSYKEKNHSSNKTSGIKEFTDEKRQITINISVSNLPDNYRGHNRIISDIMRKLDQEAKENRLLYIRENVSNGHKFTKSAINKRVNQQRIQDQLIVTDIQDKLICITISSPETDAQKTYIERLVNSFTINP